MPGVKPPSQIPASRGRCLKGTDQEVERAIPCRPCRLLRLHSIYLNSPGLGIRRAVVRSSCRLGPEHELARRLEGSEAAAEGAEAVVADDRLGPSRSSPEGAMARKGDKWRNMCFCD